MTGFPRNVRDLIFDRAGDYCEICGADRPEQAHHRRGRGMGSTKRLDSNTASNGLGISAACHTMVESRRNLALDRGWLVRQNHSPADVPVLRHGTDWVLLTDAGGVFVPPQGSGRCDRCGFHTPTQGHRTGCQKESKP